LEFDKDILQGMAIFRDAIIYEDSGSIAPVGDDPLLRRSLIVLFMIHDYAGEEVEETVVPTPAENFPNLAYDAVVSTRNSAQIRN
jgi:hypothetical protein